MFKPNKKKYNVLLWGDTSLEYAIADALKKSKYLGNLYIANTSEALQKFGTRLNYTGKNLIEAAKKHKVDIFISNLPNNSYGIIDDFEKAGIKCIGVNKKWSMLEASKHAGKKFVQTFGINHAKYEVVTTLQEFKDKIKNFSFPVVIKANGYSRGCGVFICNNYDDAFEKTKLILEKKINTTSSKVIIEEYLEGNEISFMQLWDGSTLLSFPPIKDFKRLYDNNLGPNTGGMASYFPYSLTENEQIQLNEYSMKLEKILKEEKADFRGIIYSGIIFTKKGLYILEYNMRFGCPETIALLMSLDCDFLELLIFGINKNLNNYKLKYKQGTSFALKFACKDYPKSDKQKSSISKIQINELKNQGISIFYDNGTFTNSNYLKQGNIAFTIAKNSQNPFKDIYETLSQLELPDYLYRKDISN